MREVDILNSEKIGLRGSFVVLKAEAKFSLIE